MPKEIARPNHLPQPSRGYRDAAAGGLFLRIAACSPPWNPCYVGSRVRMSVTRRKHSAFAPAFASARSMLSSSADRLLEVHRQ
jgi:hypothetical protein